MLIAERVGDNGTGNVEQIEHGRNLEVIEKGSPSASYGQSQLLRRNILPDSKLQALRNIYSIVSSYQLHAITTITVHVLPNEWIHLCEIKKQKVMS